jgi:hypothetical protein
VEGSKELQKRWLHRFQGGLSGGSSGMPDAFFIEWRTKEFWEGPAHIAGMVIDFRELNYVWGDDINVPPHEYQQFPLRIVVSDANRESLKGILSDRFFVSDLNMAFAEIKNLIQQMK